MEARVLVAYATRYGSTQEVAEAVAAMLRERGLAVDSGPMREVRGLEGYGAVVLGAPLFMFRWHKDALQFLTRHREALLPRPVAVFALGPFHDEEKEYQEVRRQLEKELAKFPWLTPQAIAIFGGKFDPQKLTFPHNLVPALKKMPASDVRDWTAIRAWANDRSGSTVSACFGIGERVGVRRSTNEGLTEDEETSSTEQRIVCKKGGTHEQQDVYQEEPLAQG